MNASADPFLDLREGWREEMIANRGHVVVQSVSPGPFLQLGITCALSARARACTMASTLGTVHAQPGCQATRSR